LPDQTNSTLVISNVAAADAAFYRVAVKDSAGDEISQNAALHLFRLDFAKETPRLRVFGPSGGRLRVEYSSTLTNSMELSTFSTGGEQFVPDSQTPPVPYRFYRAVLLP